MHANGIRIMAGWIKQSCCINRVIAGAFVQISFAPSHKVIDSKSQHLCTWPLEGFLTASF